MNNINRTTRSVFRSTNSALRRYSRKENIRNKKNPYRNIRNKWTLESNPNIQISTFSYSKKPLSVNSKDIKGRTVFHNAIRKNKSEEKIQQIISDSADGDTVDKKGRLPLHYACINKSYSKEIFDEIIGETEQVNKADYRGYTPLHISCKYGNEEAITSLLSEKNIDVNLKNKCGYTALDLLFKYAGKEVIENTVLLLLFNNAKFNKIDPTDPERKIALRIFIDLYTKYLLYSNKYVINEKSIIHKNVTEKDFNKEVDLFKKYFPGVSFEYIFSGKKYSNFMMCLFVSNQTIAEYFCRKAMDCNENSKKLYPSYGRREKELLSAASKNTMFSLRTAEARVEKYFFKHVEKYSGKKLAPKASRLFFVTGGVNFYVKEYYNYIAGNRNLKSWRLIYKSNLASEIKKERNTTASIYMPFILSGDGHNSCALLVKPEGKGKTINIILVDSYYKEGAAYKLENKLDKELGDQKVIFIDASLHIQTHELDYNCFLYSVDFMLELLRVKNSIRKKILGLALSKNTRSAKQETEIVEIIRKRVKEGCPQYFKYNKELNKYDFKGFENTISHFMAKRWEFSRQAIIKNIELSKDHFAESIGKEKERKNARPKPKTPQKNKSKMNLIKA